METKEKGTLINGLIYTEAIYSTCLYLGNKKNEEMPKGKFATIKSTKLVMSISFWKSMLAERA
jgi:hypothetical protein